MKLVLCFLTSMLTVLFFMPRLIVYLKRISFNQTVSEYSLQQYKDKSSTPIMGGIMFIIVPVVITILATERLLENTGILIILMTFTGYGLIGFTDDWLIAVKKNNDGLLPGQKFLMQLVLAIVVYVLYASHAELTVSLLFSGKKVYLGVFYMILVLLMFTGSSNAVNLTDGMDGLAGGCTAIALCAFFVIALLQGRRDVAVFIISLIGALIGYLYYNVKPARIFMGDTGSLALGGALAAIAMILKTELSLIVIGGVFVVETLCVMIQLAAVKLIHRRVFLYTPIHYAFVLKGMGERQTVHLFWLAGIACAAAGLLVTIFSF
ncbi:MAG: phospho-N-acetylmuramoyl-pentapeptide-transferase [Solobacterium sp.]|nr:phospho-N-acetylmuramoyl-pentapeptide-transferase [Solobacterium sp.]